MASEISSGNLTVGSYPGGNNERIFQDETGELECALSKMHVNLRELVGHVKEGSLRLAETADTLNRVVSEGRNSAEAVGIGTSRIFDGAFEQANNIDEASKTIKAMANLADDMEDKVTDAADASRNVNSVARHGANTATSAIQKMENVFKGIESTKVLVANLEDRISNIPKILDVINHISRQTDLLALNATIEASKAGEHGRGFAMVAEEVRRFADNTKESVDYVALIVRDVKTEAEKVVRSVSEGASFVKEGRKDMRNIRETLGDIAIYTAEVVDKGNDILALTKKQKGEADGTVKLVEEVAQIAREHVSITEEVDSSVEKNNTAMEEALAASKRFSELSKELREVVVRFKLDEGAEEKDLNVFAAEAVLGDAL